MGDVFNRVGLVEGDLCLWGKGLEVSGAGGGAFDVEDSEKGFRDRAAGAGCDLDSGKIAFGYELICPGPGGGLHALRGWALFSEVSPFERLGSGFVGDIGQEAIRGGEDGHILPWCEFTRKPFKFPAVTDVVSALVFLVTKRSSFCDFCFCKNTELRRFFLKL